MKVASKATQLRVENIMQREVISVKPDTSVTELAQMLTLKMISGAPVVDEQGEVVGVVSQADLAAHAARTHVGIEAIEKHPEYYRDLWMDPDFNSGYMIEDFSSAVQVSEIMTRQLHMIRHDATLTDLVSLLLGARIHRALVTDGERVVGIVTTMDLIKIIPSLMPLHEGDEHA